MKKLMPMIPGLWVGCPTITEYSTLLNRYNIDITLSVDSFRTTHSHSHANASFTDKMKQIHKLLLSGKQIVLYGSYKSLLICLITFFSYYGEFEPSHIRNVMTYQLDYFWGNHSSSTTKPITQPITRPVNRFS